MEKFYKVRYGGVGYNPGYVEMITETYKNIKDIPTSFAIGSKLTVIDSNDTFVLMEDGWKILPQPEDMKGLLAHQYSAEADAKATITSVVKNVSPERTLTNTGDVVYANNNIEITLGNTNGYTSHLYVNDEEVTVENSKYSLYVKYGMQLEVKSQVELNKYNVTYDLTHLTSSNQELIADVEHDYETTLSCDEGYELPETITIKVNDSTLTAGTEYTYDNTTGEVIINKEYILGNVNIAGTATEVPVEEPEENEQE